MIFISSKFDRKRRDVQITQFSILFPQAQDFVQIIVNGLSLNQSPYINHVINRCKYGLWVIFVTALDVTHF